MLYHTGYPAGVTQSCVMNPFITNTYRGPAYFIDLFASRNLVHFAQKISEVLYEKETQIFSIRLTRIRHNLFRRKCIMLEMQVS